MQSTIKLFKSLPIEKFGKKKASKKLLQKTINLGFVFSPEVISNYSDAELIKFSDFIAKEFCLTGEQANSSFHKSWKKVKDASIEQLVMEQIVHYITTYGFESLGIYNEESVYLPSEKLEIPKLDVKSFEFMVIKGYTKEQLKEKTLNLLKTGIALAENTMNDVLEICEFVNLNEAEVDLVKNKEVKIALCDYFNIFPKNPTEFLRYVIYKATGKTLLIKNNQTIEEIKESTTKGLAHLFKRYERKHGLPELAKIFHRFKPLFLAFKTQKAGPIINRLRKSAIEHHKPMPIDYLNEVTKEISNDRLDESKLKLELKKANVFRKIRLAYALKFRTQDVKSILYKIRNGKGYATKCSFKKKTKINSTLKIVLDSIVKDVKKNVKGTKIFIPEGISYSLPATEKQFTGYFPSGTCVETPKDMIVGVHWDNTDDHRIDLDLSLINIEEGKFGWDSSYRNEERTILFSGDITDAPKPNGASELFYVKQQVSNSFLLMLNYYNHDDSKVEVPFNTFVAQEQVSNMKQNYIVNPNNIVSKANSSIKVKQKILGLLTTTTKNCKFYFCETSLGKSISSMDNDYTKDAVNYLTAFYKNTIDLKYVLEKAGAKIVDNKDKCDFDLSPEKLEKDTILNLIK